MALEGKYDYINLWILDGNQEIEDDGDYGEATYAIETSSGEVFTYSVYDIDSYRSHLSTGSMNRMDLLFLRKKYLGRFNDIEIHTDQSDEEDEYECYFGYTFLSKGRVIGTAGEDSSDSYYPHGHVHFINLTDMKEEHRQAVKVFTYQVEKPLHIVTGKNAFVVTGKPRTGKTRTMINYDSDIRYIDSDGFIDPNFALDDIWRGVDKDVSFIIGKYRNTKVVTDSGERTYAEYTADLLKEIGYNVFEVHFVKRIGSDLDQYSLYIQNETDINPSSLFKEEILNDIPTDATPYISIIIRKL